ncbi:MAG: hypothetical protein GY862_26525 [Gammaproteobacteria bacterium]|nr:hypothetical protein [Gammaproteobacteria bacterium]
MHVDILIVVVTNVESQAVFDVFGKAGGHMPRSYLVGDKTYHDLGVIKGARGQVCVPGRLCVFPS